MGVRGKSLKVIRWGFAGTLIIAGGSLVWMATNHLVARVFDRLRPELERELSKPLGHPLVLGSYQGLRPWGISIGPTELRSGFNDDSTVKFSGLSIKYAPIASLFNWRPVAVIAPKGTRVELRSNANGAYWVPGTTDEVPPNIALWIRLNDPAKVVIKPSNISLTATTNSFLKLQEKKVSGSLQLSLPNQGNLLLKGKGYWDRFELQARARLNKFRFGTLTSLFFKPPVLKAQGQIDGDLQLSVKEGDFDCEGGMTLVDFSLKRESLKDSLTSQKAAITCSNKQVIFPLSQWEYGPWITSIKGEVPLTNKSKLNLGVNTSVRMQGVSRTGLDITAKLPFQLSSKGLTAGELLADLNLSPFPLSPIGSLLGTSLSGTISAKGQIIGPFSGLKTNLSIGVINPQVSSLRLQEEWRGNLSGHIDDGGIVQLSSVGAAVPSSFSANFSKNWSLRKLAIKRLGGEILVERLNDRFKWEAADFRLDRIEVAIPPDKSFKRVFGQLSGNGNFEVNPLAVDGEITLRYPRYMGLRLKEAFFKGNYIQNDYLISGEISPPDKGQVLIDAKGSLGGGLKATVEAKAVSARWITDTAFQLPKINLKATSASGKAEDLGGFFVKAFGDSLDGRLNALAHSQSSLLKANKSVDPQYQFINPNDLKGDVDAVIGIEGPDISNLNLDLKLSGQLWPKGKKNQIDLQVKPFVATIRGPLQGGMGTFSLLNVPFSLLSLIAPVPPSLAGMFGLSGKYRRSSGVPDITAELILEDARIAEKAFVLDRGDFSLSDSILKMDVLLRSSSSVEPLKLMGKLPIDPSRPIDFRVESHGDGLRFLDGLTDGALSWDKGTADLRFLIRGSRNDPEAIGFLVIKDGEILVMEKLVKGVNASMVFDFDRLELLSFDAFTGTDGTFRSSGSISLFRQSKEERDPLVIMMNNVPFELPYADVEVASNLKLNGSLLKPQIGGSLTINKGSISPPTKSGPSSSGLSQSNSFMNVAGMKKQSFLPEQKWNMQEPLSLFVQNSQSTASKILRSSMPTKFSNISFDNLRLRLGQDLQITTPPNAFTRQPLASFNAVGLLTLNGALDHTLSASGVVRLTKGRVNLFTTTFTLDRSKQNVAVFAPSMGMIPYVDVTMKSSVPEMVRSSDNLTSSSDFASNGSGAFGIGGSRLIKVEAVATGPADRISDNFQLTSRPAIPRNELIGILGGNTLTSLFGGGQAVFGNVIGQSFLSPLLGNVSDSFSDRLQVAVYPTTIVSSPKGSKESEVNNDDVTDGPQQAGVTDIGIDLNRKFNFSVQATPNRSDIPPQGTLRYEVNSNLDALGSLDKEGNWQSQLQLFLRY